MNDLFHFVASSVSCIEQDLDVDEMVTPLRVAMIFCFFCSLPMDSVPVIDDFPA